MKYRLAVLVSGRGSNLQAVIDSIESGFLDGVCIALVASDNKSARALEISRKHGIKAKFIDPGEFRTKLDGKAQDNYIKIIGKAKPDLIVLAGFMRILKDKFIKSFPGRIINIHPSLLPRYPGLHTHLRALEDGEEYTGCTVHYVNEIVDGGKRIMQARVRILPGDTGEKLSARVLEEEHKVLPMVIKMISMNKISYEKISGEPVIYHE
ncbi:MAG: phosphoribosylglycinamide formyltransferase [Brevinematales bacterium]|jgi:phosphoribosylglycinamide formyltransferase-1